MSPYIRNAWRYLRGAKASHYLLLLLGPMFIQPMAFNKVSGQAQPLYARLQGLKSVPLVAAGTFAFAMQSFYQWFFWLQAIQTPTQQSPADWIRKLHETQGFVFWGSFVFVCLFICAIALYRWGYHWCILAIFRKWQPNLPRPPFLYFLVTWSAWGMWLSLFFVALTLGLWQLDDWQELPDSINEYASNHLGVILAFILPLGLAWLVASGNSDTGRRAIYGRLALLSTVVDLLFNVALLMLVVLILRA